MNKTKIEWTDYSWNPITGCLHGCWYCYAKKMAMRFHRSFEPTFHPERLKEPYELKKPSKIFVCSVADLFAPWTPREWYGEVFDSMLWCPTKHTFQMLTKNPERIYLGGMEPIYPKNWWFGTTVTCQSDFKNIEEIKKIKCGVRFVSFEPLLGELPSYISLKGLDWVIVGKLTGSKRIPFKFEWLASVVDQTAEFQIPLFMKNNLVPIVKKERLIQQFPRVKD
jgi:protein gp37